MLFIDPIPNQLLFIVVTIIVLLLFIATIWLNFKKWDNNDDLIKILGGYDLSTFRHAMNDTQSYDHTKGFTPISGTSSTSTPDKLDTAAKVAFMEVLNSTPVLDYGGIKCTKFECSSNVSYIPFEENIYIRGGWTYMKLNYACSEYIDWSEKFEPDALVNYNFAFKGALYAITVVFEFDENDDFHSVRGTSPDLNYIKKTLNYNSMTIKNKGDDEKEHVVIVVRITYLPLSKVCEAKDRQVTLENFKKRIKSSIKYIHCHMCEIYSYFNFKGGYILNKIGNYSPPPNINKDPTQQTIPEVIYENEKIILLTKQFIKNNILVNNVKGKDRRNKAPVVNGNLGDIYERLTEPGDYYYVLNNEKINETFDKDVGLPVTETLTEEK